MTPAEEVYSAGVWAYKTFGDDGLDLWVEVMAYRNREPRANWEAIAARINPARALRFPPGTLFNP